MFFYFFKLSALKKNFIFSFFALLSALELIYDTKNTYENKIVTNDGTSGLNGHRGLYGSLRSSPGYRQSVQLRISGLKL